MFNKSTIELKKFMPKSYYFMRFLKLIDKITLFIGLPSVIKFKLYNIKELGNDKDKKNFFSQLKKLSSPITVKLNSIKNRKKFKNENSRDIKFILNETKASFLTKESRKTALYDKFTNILNK